jgi:hypothetical protein
LLTLIDFLPKKPLPFGSDTKLERKEKTYPMEYFHKHRWAFQQKAIFEGHHYTGMKSMEAIINNRMQIEAEALKE